MQETPSLNVLVIDDTESHASLVSRVIIKGGHQAHVAHSMEDALAEFENQDFDLVITDIYMEGMGGLVGIDKIRKLRPDVLIIAMSAGYEDMSATMALETASEIGADAVLPKPFPLEDLRKTVTRLLEARGGNA